MTVWTEQDSHNLTVVLVARDGHRMRLRGADRAAAIRAMVARGLDVDTIAQRLRLDVATLRTFARRWEVTLPPPQAPQAWWVEVAQPSKTTRARRRQRQAQRERATATTGSHP